jgi:LDH2 family malate/lactate/ureidoglycolate dehydrogenase
VPEGGSITLPGEPERRARQRGEERGISLDATTWSEILGAGERVGLTRADGEALAAGKP